MRNLNPTLNPLLNDLYYISIGNFLASTEFGRLSIKVGFQDDWLCFLNFVKRNKSSFVMWANTYDEEETLEIFFSEYLKVSPNLFEEIVFNVLQGFINWLKKPTDFEEVFADLEVIHFKMEYLEKLRALHAEKQAILASQAEQQASEQTAVLPAPTQKGITKESILADIKAQHFADAFEKLDNLNITDNEFVSQLAYLKKVFAMGTQTTDAHFSDRLLVVAREILKNYE